MSAENKKPEAGDAKESVIDCASPPCLLHEVDPAYSGLGDEAAGKASSAARRPAPERREEDVGRAGERPPANDAPQSHAAAPEKASL